MGRKPLSERFVRKLSAVGGKSVCVTIPKEFLEQLGWEKGKEVRLNLYGRTKQIVIEDIEDEE